jgi:hypothetical protein
LGGRLQVLIVALLVGLALRAPTLPFDPAVSAFTPYCQPAEVSFEVNGVAAPLLSAGSGDHVVATFEVPEGCTSRVTFASFLAPAPAFDGSRLAQQDLVSKDSGVFGPGRHSLEIDIFDFTGEGVLDCTGPRVAAQAASEELRRAVREQMAASPAYRAEVQREMAQRAARDDEAEVSTGPYERACEGTAADATTGFAQAHGQPCPGCVGNADDRDPPGQSSDGSDHDAGHECDRNQGIGQGNPAHSRCRNFQVDLSYHPRDEDEHDDEGDDHDDEGNDDHEHDDDDGAVHDHESGLIAGLFCVRPTGQCYVTDRTSTNAVLEG